MSSKKAIIIVFILFLIMAVVFIFLYINKHQAVLPNSGLNVGEPNLTEVIERNESAKPEETIEDKINKIIEEAENDPNASPETVRQEVVSMINNEIIKQEENKTPEQKEADLKARTERQRIIDEINSKIKQAQ